MEKISFEGIGAVVATFACGEAVTCGDLVAVSGNGEVEVADTGDAICGIALEDSDSYVGVQVKGFATLPVSGTIAVGYKLLAADGNGGLKVVTTGGATYLVVSVDSTASTATILL